MASLAEITHTTTYRYAKAVTFGTHRPCSAKRAVRLRDFWLSVKPVVLEGTLDQRCRSML